MSTVVLKEVESLCCQISTHLMASSIHAYWWELLTYETEMREELPTLGREIPGDLGVEPRKGGTGRGRENSRV